MSKNAQTHISRHPTKMPHLHIQKIMFNKEVHKHMYIYAERGKEGENMELNLIIICRVSAKVQ